MNILVLDTIHGGNEIARGFEECGHNCCTVDVYRHESGIPEREAVSGLNNGLFTLAAAPVHLDPENPILQAAASAGVKVISHHEALKMILDDKVSRYTAVTKKEISRENFIEITGAQGKTTTAYAAAHMLSNSPAGAKGVIRHSSKETVLLPDTRIDAVPGITPGAALKPAIAALARGTALVLEESIGVSGFGGFAVLTSAKDYTCANGTKSALDEKIKSLAAADKVLIGYGADAELIKNNPFFSGIAGGKPENVFFAEDIVTVDADACIKDGETIFTNPLLADPGYRAAAATAAALAFIGGFGKEAAAALSSLKAIEGREFIETKDGITIVDDSNSGVNQQTAIAAASAARSASEGAEIILVIGIEDKKICEGFAPKDIIAAVKEIKPAHAVIVGDYPDKSVFDGICASVGYAETLAQGKHAALALAAESAETGAKKSIVLSVKTWR